MPGYKQVDPQVWDRIHAWYTAWLQEQGIDGADPSHYWTEIARQLFGDPVVAEVIARLNDQIPGVYAHVQADGTVAPHGLEEDADGLWRDTRHGTTVTRRTYELHARFKRMAIAGICTLFAALQTVTQEQQTLDWLGLDLADDDLFDLGDADSD